MGTDVTKPFDARDFEEELANKIKAEFTQLIPDEVFTQMVRDVLDRFTKPQKQPEWRGSSHHVTYPSQFESAALEVLKEWVQAEVKVVLDSEEWRAHWNGDSNVVGKEITKLLKENAGEIVASVLGVAMASAITDMRNRI